MALEKEEYNLKMEEKLEKAFRKEEASLAGFFIKNFRFTYLIMFVIILLGGYSLFTMPREANPEVKVPYAFISTFMPGASPADTEELITTKVEEKIKNLESLSRYTSSSGQGISFVFVEFEAEADLDESFRKLREAVNDAEPNLPDEAEDPEVTELNFSDIPIVTYSLVGDLSDAELKKYAAMLQDEFEDIKNVSRIVILGGLEREFRVIVDQTKLANYNITLGQISNAIALANINIPSGEIEIDGFKYNVRVEGKFSTVDTLKNIVVSTKNGTPIYLRDLGEIIDGFKERETESRIGFKNELPRNTVSLQVYKKTGGNILDIVEETNAVISKLQADGTLGEEIIVQKTNDNSIWIKDDLNRLGKSGLQTMILIILILLIVLSFRGAFITGLSVPIAFLMAFIFLDQVGQTINGITLFSLVLALGLMVDNSIVIIEGIDEYVSKHSRSVYQAAILSVWNFKWPIVAGTMTTVCAFLPILLVSGILGEYLAVLPITLSATLISSLFVAIIIIPTLVSRFLTINNNGKAGRNKKRHEYIDAIRTKLQTVYSGILRSILPSKEKRRLIIATAWILFILSVALPFTGLMEIEMFGDVDVDYIVVNIKAPVGTVLATTKGVTEKVEEIVAKLPELDNYVTSIGTSESLGYSDDIGSTATHLANITVNFVDDNERERKSYEIAEALRDEFAAIQGAEITVGEISAGPPTGLPIEIRIYGDDLEDLEQIAENIKKYFNLIDGVINVSDSIAESTGDFTFKIDKEKASFYGLSIASIASTLRNAIYGAQASFVTINGEDIDITVKYSDAVFSKVNDLENILLFTPAGENIPVKQIAKLTIEPSLLSIAHRDGQRVVNVTAGVEAGVNLQSIIKNFNDYTAGLTLPDNARIELGGEFEDIEQSYRELFLSMILSIILIAFILVLMFNSFRQPFIILFSLPLAIIGVMIGLNILGMTFSFTVFIGLVALAGIAVNDAIVLIDRINKNIADGMEFIESIIEGGVARMQPIFLTTLTTIAGIFPLIFADELWRGLAITVIFGLLFATILTLVMVPIIYVGLCRKEKC